MDSVTEKSCKKVRARNAYLCSVMMIINSPPATDHFVVWSVSVRSIATRKPRLVGANEMNHADARLKMTICRYILVVSGRCHIVSK